MAYLQYGDEYEVLAEIEGYNVAGSNIWFEIDYEGRFGYVHISYTNLGGTPYTPENPLSGYVLTDYNNLDAMMINNARLWQTSKIYSDVKNGQSALLLIETGNKVLNYNLSVTTERLDYHCNYFAHGVQEDINVEMWTGMAIYNKAFPLNIQPFFRASHAMISERGELLDLDYAIERSGFFGQYKTSETQLLLPNTKYIIEIQNTSGWATDITVSLTAYESNVTNAITYLLQEPEFAIPR
jgi:hypothetical protein